MRDRPKTRGERNCAWIEEFCLDGDQPVRLTSEQCALICKVYDCPDGMHPVPVAGPLAGYLILLHLAGFEAPGSKQAPPPVEFACDVFTTWSASGPRLCAVLRRHGERIACPELGTLWPSAA